MKTSFALLIGLLLVKVIHVEQAAASETSATLLKEAVLEQSPVKGGLLVHLGAENAELLLAFAAEPRFVCHGLTTDPDRRTGILQALNDGTAYGRTSVDTLNHSRLPYADNLVRILVVEAASGVAEHEMLRVLCPGGLLYAKSATGWTATYKEWPSAIDEWTHARHGADGNFVSKDEAVGRPSNVRWISAAQYRGVQPRQTQVIVTSAGRLFSVRDTDTNATLTAQDAFSGVKLWEVPYTSYKKPSLRHRDFWNFPSLIARKDTLFITGKALDASSGDERFVLDGNPLTSGVYQKVYDKRLGITPTKPAAALLSGWLVGDGGSVQIDRLGAFEIDTGKSVVLFDTRVNEANTAKQSSYKNGSRRNDFDRWLSSAEDTDRRLFNASIAPKGSVAIASSKTHWVAVTEDQLILLDKDRKEVFRVALGSEHNAIPHGIAIADSRVYVSTAAGHVLCFGAPIQ